MRDHVIIYNPEDIQIERVHDFTDPISSWGDEIIAELLVDPYHDDEFFDWIRDWTYYTDIVASVCTIDHPEQQHLFRDIYPNSPVQDIINRENPGGDIRKYLTDLYGGVDQSIKFDSGRTQNIMASTGFEPMSMRSIRELSRKGYLESGTTHDDLHYPTGGEILSWAEEVESRFPETEFGAIAQLHFTSGDVEAGCTGFVIYNADDTVFDWVKKKWCEVEDTNMKYPPSELDLKDVNDEYLPPDAPLIRMWWD